MDVCEKQYSALWRTRFGRRGWFNGGLRNIWQSDVPRCIHIKFATGRAHQYSTRFSGPQKWLLQGPYEVIPEQLNYIPTDLLISQMETDTRLTYCLCHSLFICITLGKGLTEKNKLWEEEIKKTNHCIWTSCKAGQAKICLEQSEFKHAQRNISQYEHKSQNLSAASALKKQENMQTHVVEVSSYS